MSDTNSKNIFLTEDPTKHITEVVPFFRSLGLPLGYKLVLTKEVKEGDIVYLMGSKLIEDGRRVSTAYGPNTVIPNIRPHDKLWVKGNETENTFCVNSEELLLKVT